MKNDLRIAILSFSEAPTSPHKLYYESHFVAIKKPLTDKFDIVKSRYTKAPQYNLSTKELLYEIVRTIELANYDIILSSEEVLREVSKIINSSNAIENKISHFYMLYNDKM